ncbi:purine nucleoside phosphorylase-like isoform X2 [Euwallacea fornicatus]|uniref:purine nucleoside phosphorylase-like isoform X2 n=1 Tax=Euwallacea fornicatus TaxID=995702 RepID=UPI00338EC80B
MNHNEFNHEFLQNSADYLKAQLSRLPVLLIICGSGLGSVADTLSDPILISYEDIPGFPKSTVEGHAGELIFGTLSKVPVACMKGRFHYFEGYSLQKITTPIRVMKLLGVKGLIITNAAGGVNPKYKPGDLMVIKDHINFLAFGGQHPLRGQNDLYFGDRFFPMNKAYNKQLIDIARVAAKDVGFSDNYHEGVYGLYAGPNYETIAEVKVLKMLGVDAAGMSTVPEVLVAKHCGMTVFGFSFITNRCIDSYDDVEEPNHVNILDVVDLKSSKIQDFVVKFVEKSREKWL